MTNKTSPKRTPAKSTLRKRTDITRATTVTKNKISKFTIINGSFRKGSVSINPRKAQNNISKLITQKNLSLISSRSPINTARNSLKKAFIC